MSKGGGQGKPRVGEERGSTKGWGGEGNQGMGRRGAVPRDGEER